jgi:hypothetical protein
LLGIGLLSVRDGLVVVHCDPGVYQPRKQPKMRARLLSEFTRRSGDYNVGGTTKRPRVTAYREEALRCAHELAVTGATSPARLRDATSIPKASGILSGNVYGWFKRIEHGVYDVTPEGRAALALYADVVQAQLARFAKSQEAVAKLVVANPRPAKSKRKWLASRGGVQREFPTRKLAEQYASGAAT